MRQMIDKIVYTEMYEILKHNEEFAKKLPAEIITHIKKKGKNTGYKLNYDSTKDIFSQVRRETLAFTMSIYLKYIAGHEEKEELKKMLIENEIEYKKL